MRFYREIYEPSDLQNDVWQMRITIFHYQHHWIDPDLFASAINLQIESVFGARSVVERKNTTVEDSEFFLQRYHSLLSTEREINSSTAVP